MARWALDFPKYALEDKLGSYSIQRALPSLLGWAALKLLHVQPTATSVILAFEVMNIVMMFVATLAWTKIARLLQIRAPDTRGAASDFPAQTVFMSQGPWMSNLMYLVQLPIVVLVGLWLHGVLARREAEFESHKQDSNSVHASAASPVPVIE